MGDRPVEPSIAPWLSVSDCEAALRFYGAAFAADEVYRLDGDDGRAVVARMTVDGAPLWVQEDDEAGPDRPAPDRIRMIVTVADPMRGSTERSRRGRRRSPRSPKRTAGARGALATRSITTGSSASP